MSNTKTSTQLQTQETQRRNEERNLRQQNHNGQTTMRSPLARLLVTSLRTTTEKEKENAKSYTTTLLSSNVNFLLIGKSTCPRCIQAVELLSALPYPLQVVMLDELIPPQPQSAMPAKSATTATSATSATTAIPPATTVQAIQDYLWDLTGARTVPRIFFNQTSLGGYDDVLERYNNKTLIPFITTRRRTHQTSQETKVKETNSVARIIAATATRTASTTQVTVAQVTVEYKGTIQTCFVLPTMTGLQMKSYILNEFKNHFDIAMDCSFGSFYLQCQNQPFASRTRIDQHEHFQNNCHLVLEDVGDRPKAVGYT